MEKFTDDQYNELIEFLKKKGNFELYLIKRYNDLANENITLKHRLNNVSADLEHLYKELIKNGTIEHKTLTPEEQ